MIRTPENTTVGWIGTGVMGRWMCSHLINGGYKAVVSNRTLSKCDPLKELGATVVDTPKEVAEKSGTLFLYVRVR